MNKLTFVMTGKELNTAVETTIHNTKEARKVLHRVLVSCALHAQLHGDCRPMTRYITGLKEAGKHVRVNAMVKSIHAHTPMYFDKKQLKFRLVKGRVWDVDTLIKTPFYSDPANEGAAEGSKEWNIETYLKVVASNLKKHGIDPATVLKVAA